MEHKWKKHFPPRPHCLVFHKRLIASSPSSAVVDSISSEVFRMANQVLM